jgi:glutamate dehydrogenase/leucine dehydrogenase
MGAKPQWFVLDASRNQPTAEASIVEEAESIWLVARDLSIDLRTAAYVHALTRLVKRSARRARGTII